MYKKMRQNYNMYTYSTCNIQLHVLRFTSTVDSFNFASAKFREASHTCIVAIV